METVFVRRLAFVLKCLLISGASFPVVPAFAKEPIGEAVPDVSASARMIDQLADCRSQADDVRRLACFDRTVAAVVDARRRKDIVILDRTEVRKAKTSLFGFSLPSIKLFNGDGDDEQMKALVGTMRNSVVLPSGLIRFDLGDPSASGSQDGKGTGTSVWETVEQVMLPPRRGDTVTIKSGALGSYVATAPGRRSARVRRIR